MVCAIDAALACPGPSGLPRAAFSLAAKSESIFDAPPSLFLFLFLLECWPVVGLWLASGWSVVGNISFLWLGFDW